MRSQARRLTLATTLVLILAACGEQQPPETGPMTTEPVVQTEGGEVDEEAAQERAEDLMGRAEEDVAELEDVRVVHRDGESLDVTDLLPGRMNVTIEDSVVVDVSVEQDPGPANG